MLRLLSYFLVIISVVFADYNNTIENENLESPDGLICITRGCVKSAATMLQNLDESVDPCDDFYEFACGGFVKNHPIPEDRTRINFFNIVGDRIVLQLRQLFEEPPTEEELRPFKLVKVFYQSCLNTAQIEHDGLTTVKRMLNDLNGWPVLEGPSWEEDNFEWQQIIFKLAQLGLPTSHILNIYVGRDVINSSNAIINIDQASLNLEREYLIEGWDNDVVQEYYDFLVDVAVIFGADKERASEEMNATVLLEKRLAEICLAKEDRRNITLITNPMSVQDLQQRFPSIQWPNFLGHLLSPKDYVVALTDMVDVGVPKYISQLEDILKETPKRVLANYLLNRVVIHSIVYLTKELRDRQLRYDESYQGSHQMLPRWKECVIMTAERLNVAVDSLYVRNHVSDETKTSAEELIETLKKTFIDSLHKIDWMDENTKQEALAKAELMHAKVAYPKEMKDDAKIEEYYAELEPVNNTFLEFALEIDKFKDVLGFEQLLGLGDEKSWAANNFVCTVDAYYDMLDNSLQLSAGILQGIFFDVERPTYMNYGSMGFAIAHEITHGFDDEGRQYDKNGNLRDWWATQTNDLFIEKAQCIIDRYNNCVIPEINLYLNGYNTQGENIADIGAVKQAYLAYDAWMQKNGEEPKLPGLNYTTKQLFWISMANSWCENQRSAVLKQYILSNVHVPHKYRVLVPFSNSEQFSKDFSCPTGSNMNPAKKCQIW